MNPTKWQNGEKKLDGSLKITIMMNFGMKIPWEVAPPVSKSLNKNIKNAKMNLPQTISASEYSSEVIVVIQKVTLPPINHPCYSPPI